MISHTLYNLLLRNGAGAPDGLPAPSGLPDASGGILGATGAPESAPEPPAYPLLAPAAAPRPGFLDRLAASAASAPAYAPRPYESALSAGLRGAVSGLERGYGSGRLLDMQTRQANDAAKAKAEATAADRNYSQQMESWKLRLKKYMDDSGNVVVGNDLVKQYPGLSPFKGKAAPLEKFLPYMTAQDTAGDRSAKTDRTVNPSDAPFLDGLVSDGNLSRTQANYFKKNGMTEAERSKMATDNAPAQGGGMLGGNNAPMTPGAISFVGDYLIRTGQLLPFGMGNGANRGKVFDYVQKKASASDVAGNKAALTSDQAALTQTQRALDGTSAFEGTARANVQVLKPYISKLKETGSPLLNAPIREWEARVAGDPNMSGFRTALQTVVNEYSRLLTASPTMAGEMSDAARREGSRLLDGSMTMGQLVESLNVLERDAQNRLGSYQRQIDTIKGRIGSGGRGGREQGAATHVYDPATGTIKPVGGQ